MRDADPNSMQTRVMCLEHRNSDRVVKHRSAESEDLRFDSSWGLRIFLRPTLVTRRKNIFPYFFTELKTYYLSLILFTNMTFPTSLILAVCRTRVI